MVRMWGLSLPKVAKELSALEVKRLTKAGFYSVGGVSGLMLQVTKTGARSWILRATVGMKRRDIGLGGFSSVSLASAKEKAREVKDKIKQGIDPVEERKSIQRKIISDQLSTITFKPAALRYIREKKAGEYRNPRQVQQWVNSLENYAFPYIAEIPVKEVGLMHIQAILNPIWHTKTETANRVRSRIENILGWCAVNGFREGQNPAQWTGYLDKIYPSPNKIKNVTNHKALPVEEMPAFMSELKQREGIAAKALIFLILTCARTNEVIGDKRIKRLGATAKEINLDEAVWTIPEDRMKGGKEHVVPISDYLLEMLKGMNLDKNEDKLIFSGADGNIASNNYLSSVLKRMGVSCTVHGFRSTFKDWCRKYTSYDDEVSELALAHVNNDATRAAYARDSLIEKRRLLMNDWAKYCFEGKSPTAKVHLLNPVRQESKFGSMS